MTNNNQNRWLRLDRMLTSSLRKQIQWIICVLFITWIISYICLSLSGTQWQDFCAEKDILPILLPLYLLIDTNALNNLYMSSGGGAVHGWMLFFSSVTYIIGLLVFNGIIISVLSNYIALRKENYNNGISRYSISGHYVIMGFDEMIPSIISDIFSKDKNAHILVLSAVPSTLIREHLRKSVKREYFNQIVVYYGHRAAKEYYSDIHLESAKEIFVVGKRSLPNHDAVNVECVESICDYLSEMNHSVLRITCVFEDLDTYASFRTTDIFSDITNKLNIEFVPYNFYVNWARRIFINQSYIGKKNQQEYQYPYICKQGIGVDDEHYVHLVFVGITYFAVTFANEAANVLHFPNFKKAKTKITFIDIKADTEMPIFVTRNHHFFEVQPYYYGDYTENGDKIIRSNTTRNRFKDHNTGFLDIDFEFIKGDIFSNDIQNLIYEWAKDEKQYLSVFLAMVNQRDNFAIAMNMPDAIYNNSIPVYVRQDSSDNFITLLRQADTNAPRKGFPEYRWYDGENVHCKESHGRYANIYPFGMNDMSFLSDEVSFKRAKLVNYLYQTADYSANTFQSTLVLSSITTNQLWKEVNDYWKDLTVAEKWSNLYFAYGINYKLLSLRAMRKLNIDDDTHDGDTLTLSEIEVLSEAEHNRWNVEKLLMGYRKPLEKEDMYNKPSDVARKLKNNKNLFIHAHIRPYDSLTDDVKQLDIEFAKYIPWIIQTANK